MPSENPPTSLVVQGLDGSSPLQSNELFKLECSLMLFAESRSSSDKPHGTLPTGMNQTSRPRSTFPGRARNDPHTPHHRITASPGHDSRLRRLALGLTSRCDTSIGVSPEPMAFSVKDVENGVRVGGS